MEDATPIFALKEESTNIRKQPLDVMSYSDVLRSMESGKQQQQQQQQQTPPATLAEKPSHNYLNNNNNNPPQTQTQATGPPVVSYTYPTSPHILDPTYPAAPAAPPAHAPALDKMKQFQNEMIVLLVSYIVIHMSTVQDWMRSKIPNIVSPETGAMSVLGLLTNGVLLIVLWNVAKRLILKYMQDV